MSKFLLGGFSVNASEVLRLILVWGSLESVQGSVHLLIYSRFVSILAFIKECDGWASLDVRCGSRRQLVAKGHRPSWDFLFLYFLVLTIINLALIVYHGDQILRHISQVDCLVAPSFLIAFQCVEAVVRGPTNLFWLLCFMHDCVCDILLVALSNFFRILEFRRHPWFWFNDRQPM